MFLSRRRSQQPPNGEPLPPPPSESSRICTVSCCRRTYSNYFPSDNHARTGYHSGISSRLGVFTNRPNTPSQYFTTSAPTAGGAATPRACGIVGTSIPCSLIVGTLGKDGSRFSVSAAITRSVPALICSPASLGLHHHHLDMSP